VGELIGVLAAVLSSALGGTAIGATRYLRDTADPLTLGVVRFGIGVILLLPAALVQARGRPRWPSGPDLARTAGLGLLFFALFPVLLNASLAATTAARGALALSTLPLLTMAVGAGLGVEALTWRKGAGVLVATAGVALALVGGLGAAPPGAWRGDLLMVAAAFCMALYNVWSRPLIRRTGPIPFTVAAMAVGVVVLSAIAGASGGLDGVPDLGLVQILALLYLGVAGGALSLLLWSFALARTTPTRVAVSVTVNPVTASLVGALLLGEPIGWTLVAGLAAVLAGITIASR
jgi:drug/metabolite transporter (DMT)-like permease